MTYQMTFQRYEQKYLLDRRQKELLQELLDRYMEHDRYGRSSIRNIYYDTDDYRLARCSIEKPKYKEKLRVRSYARAGDGDPVFVELKKKYRSVVYKRRVTVPAATAARWLGGEISLSGGGQIFDEIEYLRDYYGTLCPAAFLSYQREAFHSPAGDDFRVTLDERILSREEELTLDSGLWGTALISGDRTLMELKSSLAIPLWMTRFLTGERIYRTSFSKYGEAYQSLIRKNLFGGMLYA